MSQRPVLLRTPEAISVKLDTLQPGTLVHVKIPKALRRHGLYKSFVIGLCVALDSQVVNDANHQQLRSVSGWTGNTTEVHGLFLLVGVDGLFCLFNTQVKKTKSGREQRLTTLVTLVSREQFLVSSASYQKTGLAIPEMFL